MKYEIRLSEDGSFIFVKYTGDIDSQIALKSTLESQQLAKEHGLHCILVDVVESKNSESAYKNYVFAYEDFQVPEIDRWSCVALLVAPDDHSHDFVETLMRNNGRDVTIFRDREKAIQHLMSSPKFDKH